MIDSIVYFTGYYTGSRFIPAHQKKQSKLLIIYFETDYYSFLRAPLVKHDKYDYEHFFSVQ